MDFTVSSNLELLNAVDIINSAASEENHKITITTKLDFENESTNIILNNQTELSGINYSVSGIKFPINLQIQVKHDNFYANNLTIEGPHNGHEIGTDPTTGGFYIQDFKNARFDKMNIHSFSYYGILLRRSTAKVENSWFHHNRKSGLGYGIVLEGNGFLEAYSNLMEQNRHCIAGTGDFNQGYIVMYNTFGKPGIGSASRLDMHGAGEVTGGTFMEIAYNRFTSTAGVDIGIRGVATNTCNIHHNSFTHVNEKSAITQQQHQFQFGRLQFENMNLYENYYNIQ